jgi:AcrR family transcriptional regulator
MDQAATTVLADRAVDDTAADGPDTGEPVIDLRDRFLDRRSADVDADATEARRLLDAALVVIERSGWRGLKVDRVLREAGLSTRSLYRHFRGKDELLAVLLDEEVVAALDLVEAEVERASDPCGKLTAWIETFMSFAADDGLAERTQFFLTLGGNLERELPEEVARVRTMIVDSLSTIIEEGRRQGLFPHANPARDASVIHCLTVGSMIAAHESGVPPSGAEAARFALRALTS